MPRAKPGERFGGRQKGAINKRTAAIREIANKAIERGVTPIDVMLDNMRFYHLRAEQMLKQFDDIVNEQERDDETVKVAAAALVRFGEARMRAQQCATDAANYVHPRLSAVAVKGMGDDGPALFNLIMFGGEQPQPKLINGHANGNGSDR